jgi:hypothetical protein
MINDAYVPLVERATVAITASASNPARSQSLGTGFFLTPDLVATCGHVIADSIDEHRRG